MHIRKTHLIGAIAAAAALTAGAVGAQTFDQSVNAALTQSGVIASQVRAEKAISIQGAVEAQRGGGRPGGGWHPGNPGGNHGGWHPGNPGGDHGGWHPGNPGGDHGGWHPGHVPDHRPDHRPDHDWNRWHGHPGWGGHFNDRWGWDAYGRPQWLGWAVWSGFGRENCLSYYRDLSVSCHADCGAEADACVSNCSIYAPGDPSCVSSCGDTGAFCNESCSDRYDESWRSCPIF